MITDRDVMTGRVGRTIVLDERTLITPSARDRAARLGIPIVERDAAPGPARSPAPVGEPAPAPGGTSAPAPAPAPGCACPCAGVAGRSDGSWLVRVEGGRVVSVLAAAGVAPMVRARREGPR